LPASAEDATNRARMNNYKRKRSLGGMGQIVGQRSQQRPLLFFSAQGGKGPTRRYLQTRPISAVYYPCKNFQGSGAVFGISFLTNVFTNRKFNCRTTCLSAFTSRCEPPFFCSSRRDAFCSETGAFDLSTDPAGHPATPTFFYFYRRRSFESFVLPSSRTQKRRALFKKINFNSQPNFIALRVSIPHPHLFFIFVPPAGGAEISRFCQRNMKPAI